MKILEIATDLMVMGECSLCEDHPDRIVQRTPDEPNFWFGNRVIFKEAPTDAQAAIAQFHADFPDAEHICLCWDVPDLSLEAVTRLFEGTDIPVDQGDALTLSGPIRRPPLPEGVTLRAFAGDEDWAQRIAIDLEDRPENVSEADYLAYIENHVAKRRDEIAAGRGQWFGAFEGDVLLGDMGIFHDADLIRYQSVQTRESARRRGIASALLVVALDWAQARAPNALPVIVADAGSDAGRLYRRAGFALAQTNVAAYRGPLTPA